MHVVGTFMAFNVGFMMWKSASSSGWEYLVMLRGLGFKSFVC